MKTLQELRKPNPNEYVVLVPSPSYPTVRQQATLASMALYELQCGYNNADSERKAKMVVTVFRLLPDERRVYLFRRRPVVAARKTLQTIIDTAGIAAYS